MSSVYFLKKDLGFWVKKNYAKLICVMIFCLFLIVLAIKNAFSCDAQAVYGESKTLFSFLRGEISVVNVLLKLIIEWLLLLTFLILCTYNNFTVIIMLVPLGYEAYVAFYSLVIVIRNCLFSAIFFALSYVLVTALSLFVLSYLIITLIESQCHYKYGVKEVKRAILTVYPAVFIIVLIILLELILLCLSKIFI